MNSWKILVLNLMEKLSAMKRKRKLKNDATPSIFNFSSSTKPAKRRVTSENHIKRKQRQEVAWILLQGHLLIRYVVTKWFPRISKWFIKCLQKWVIVHCLGRLSFFDDILLDVLTIEEIWTHFCSFSVSSFVLRISSQGYTEKGPIFSPYYFPRVTILFQYWQGDDFLYSFYSSLLDLNVYS